MLKLIKVKGAAIFSQSVYMCAILTEAYRRRLLEIKHEVQEYMLPIQQMGYFHWCKVSKFNEISSLPQKFQQNTFLKSVNNYKNNVETNRWCEKTFTGKYSSRSVTHVKVLKLNSGCDSKSRCKGCRKEQDKNITKKVKHYRTTLSDYRHCWRLKAERNKEAANTKG